jgi:hypothetical protein
VSETSIRWAAASEQMAQNRAQLTQQQRPVMSDAQREALGRMSPEQAFHYAYSRADDDTPRPPEAPHPASLQARQQASPPGWRQQFDRAWEQAFAPLPRKGDEAPWTQAIGHGQRTGVLPAPPPPAPAAPKPEIPATPAEPAAEPLSPAPPATDPFADLFAQFMEASNQTTPPPSPEAQLRNLWRTLPDDDRQAVARHLEAADFAEGYFAGLDADWAAVLTGDALTRRLEDARRLQPDLEPATLLQTILSAAKQQD